MMKLPDQERVGEALSKIQGLSAAEIEAYISERIGDPMMAAIVLVAKNLQGGAPDEQTLAARVQLMVYSYLLCTEAFAGE